MFTSSKLPTGCFIIIAIWTQIVVFEIQAMEAAILVLDGVNITESYLSHDQYWLHHRSYYQKLPQAMWSKESIETRIE